MPQHGKRDLADILGRRYRAAVEQGFGFREDAGGEGLLLAGGVEPRDFGGGDGGVVEGDVKRRASLFRGLREEVGLRAEKFDESRIEGHDYPSPPPSTPPAMPPTP